MISQESAYNLPNSFAESMHSYDLGVVKGEDEWYPVRSGKPRNVGRG